MMVNKLEKSFNSFSQLIKRPQTIIQAENRVKSGWDNLSDLPFGKRVFSYLVGKTAPYSGNIKAQIEELRPGFAKVLLRDRSSIRNHIKSIHAVALANLAELAGNIALSYSLPENSRFIVAKMDIDYIKKARGDIYATSHCPIPKTNKRKEYTVLVEIYNAQGELLCKASLVSLVGPKS